MSGTAPTAGTPLAGPRWPDARPPAVAFRASLRRPSPAIGSLRARRGSAGRGKRRRTGPTGDRAAPRAGAANDVPRAGRAAPQIVQYYRFERSLAFREQGQQHV
ncbi:hypothetical protein GCM10009546_45980 [Actinomadura livida]|uniref:Uncharacterized protein n=1 Tax=Actinomadura livida TaxID=79909 RepID=A0ABN1EZB5_9ACTN|nr:hypothetical protein GCM10010208_12810 [Actinomadura livida]